MGVTTHSYQFTLTKGGIVPEKTMYARVFEFGGRHSSSEICRTE